MSTEKEIALSLNSAITRLSRRIRRIDDQQDIGRARLSALSVLVFGGSRNLSQLAQEEMVSTATMHHVVKGLISLGLAKQERDSDDGRRYTISATAKGFAFMEKARAARLDFYQEHISELSKKEQQAIETFARLALKWLET